MPGFAAWRYAQLGPKLPGTQREGELFIARSSHRDVRKTVDAIQTRGIGMKGLIFAAGLIATVILASCGSDGSSEPTSQTREKDNVASTNDATDLLEGTWHTEFTCLEMIEALDWRGVPKPVLKVVKVEFGLDQLPSKADPCAGVSGTADHTLRFGGGHFALFAGDKLGWETSYELIDQDTFVAEAEGLVTFDFRIEGDMLYTHVVKPRSHPFNIAVWESAPWERES